MEISLDRTSARGDFGRQVAGAFLKKISPSDYSRDDNDEFKDPREVL